MNEPPRAMMTSDDQSLQRDTRSEQRSTRIIKRAAGILAILILAYATVVSWHAWTEEKTDSSRDLATIVELEARAINGYFAQLESSLKGLGGRLPEKDGELDLDRAHVLLKDFKEEHAELFNVTLIKPDGEVLLTARNPPGTARASLAKEASFIAFLDDLRQGRTSALGQPLIGVVSRVVIVPVRVAIRDRQGKLRHILSANLPQEHLQSFWKSAPITGSAAIGLMRDNGYLLSRYPVPAGLSIEKIYGQPRTGVLINHLQKQKFPASGYAQGPSSLDGPDFLNAFHRLQDYPVTLFVALPMSEIRSEWWKRVASTYLSLTILLLAGFATYRYALHPQLKESREQIRLTNAQRESNERYVSLFTNAKAAMLLIDPLSGSIIDANPAAQEFYGYDHVRFLQMNISDINTLATEKILLEMQLAKQQQRACFYFPHRLANGRIREVEVHAGPIRIGERTLLYSIIHDVTDRKRAEEALRASELLKQTILDSVAAQIAVVDSEGIIQTVNEPWRRFGQENPGPGGEPPKGTDVGSNYLSACRIELDTSSGEVRTAEEGISAVLAGRLPGFSLEYPCHSPNRQRWFWMNVLPLGASANAGVVITHTEITERKEADAARDRLLKIIDEAPDFISMADMQTHLIFLNASGARMVGLPEDADLSALEIKDVHPQWAARLIMDEGIPSALRDRLWQAETALLHRDDHEIPVSQLLLVHRGESGRPDYLSTIMRDISPQKAHERELTVARNAAESANTAKSRFLATMSHEIRTPMNGILGMAQMLLMPSLGDAERRDYARIVLNSGQTLMALLDDILDLSKVESGKFELISAAFEPDQVIRESCTLFAESATRKGLKIETAWSGPPDQRYLGDPRRLRQMLTNFVGNAIKFTEHGQLRIDAREIWRDEASATLEFAVSDTGIGIPPDKLPLLFQPFSQADNSSTRQYGGTGLGLSIVRALAEMMGGETGVTSEPGQGSRFWFRINARLIAAGDSRQADWSGRHDGDRGAASRFSGHVLALEDDSTNRKVIRALLGALGLTVSFAHDGQAGLEAIMRGEPADLILMDLQMPVMDGFDATERIRRWERQNGHARHPIIALSAEAFDEDRQRCLAAGMDDFLTKPIASMDILAMALRRWLPAGAEITPGRAPAATAEIPTDTARIVAILRDLEPMLAQNMFAAVARFKDLQEAVAGTEFADELEDTKSLMAELRFDQVKDSLHRLAALHGWGDQHHG
jgi:PAS domain S-box-containing protein